MPLKKNQNNADQPETDSDLQNDTVKAEEVDPDDDDGDDEDDEWISDIGLHSNLRSKL